MKETLIFLQDLSLNNKGKATGDIIIETPRLRFRTWRDSDAEILFRYASDPEVGPRAGWPPHKSIEESLSVIRDIFSNNLGSTYYSPYNIS